ncbi:hypothetical protein C8F04DRAFT_1164189 [Mycena alexandri]|uniref:Telomere-associated protein Rif1 N-terminal domain-containing protein n=1 Tax=Mycena alexandri TaxID=1745969 RepID=A0AAD6RWP9_9AGAR|nr:hypothetical protein C8F04DRAFT_1164189 [Mycena alexandri]
MKLTVQKENFLSKELRTTWTAQEKHRPPAKVASAPLKSILKNTSTVIPSSYMPPAAKAPIDGALASPAYFMSAAENATGVHGIRTQIRGILSAEATLPALTSLAECCHQLSEVLRRDLIRTREEPFPQSRRTSFKLDSIQSISELDEEIIIARDLALLSQQVLRFLSDIFSFPALHSIFSTNDLRLILGELLVLGSASYLPSPSSQRTWTLLVWILSVQTLPSAVLSPVKREIVTVLKRAVDGEIGKGQAKLDALQASSQLLTQYPSLFISPLLAIFPCILQHLIADSAIIRLQAVNALGRFALAKINTLSTSANSCHASIAETLTTFINTQTSKLKSIQSELRLRPLITAALTTRSPKNPADSPFWVVQLLASFVVLLGDSVFSNPRAIKLTLQSLQEIAVHKQKLVKCLHPYVWKCLVWVFSRLPISTDDKTRDSVFLTLIQDLRGGIGLALILSLLAVAPNDGSCDTSDSVKRILEVVKDMMSNGEPNTQAEGVALLTQLLYTPTPPTAPAAPYKFNILVPQLFNGSLVPSKGDNVFTTVRNLERLDPGQVRQLTDAEILHHWDALADRWVKATNISLSPGFEALKLKTPYLTTLEYKQNLLHGWQSLLLMPSDLTQGFAHLTTQEPFATKIGALICSFIAPSESSEAQVQRLVLVRKMWRTMTNVFQRDWLSSLAETVLVAVLKQGYNLADEQIRGAWAELCSELISLGLPSAVGIVREQGEAQMPAELQKQLWLLAVKSIGKSDAPAPWMDVAYLISIPFGAWSMTKSEIDIWNRLLKAAMRNADLNQATLFVEYVFENIKDLHRLSDSPNELATLLSHVNLAGRTGLPQVTISALVKVLNDLYPQVLAPISLQIIQRIRDIILSAPSTLALPLLLELQDSICKWLEDDANVLGEDARREITECLFSAPLSTIHGLEPSGKNLVLISRFLATVADADAFEKFWRVTYHGRDEFYDLYPESIKTSLRAFTDVFGGSLAADLSMENHSQMESSCAPDSQSSQAIPTNSLDYYADESRYPLESDTLAMGDTRFMDVADGSASTARPPSSPIQPATSPPATSPPPRAQPVFSAALDQLQDYSSRLDESSVLSIVNASASSHSTVRGKTPQALSQSNSSTRSSKRVRTGVDDTSASKRRKTSPEIEFIPPESNAVAVPSRCAGESISEPVSRRPSVGLSDHALSQPIPSSRKREGKRKIVLECVQIPTYQESKRRRLEFSLPTPSPSFRPPPPRQPNPPDDEEDYDSWEASLSIAQVQHVQHELGATSDYPSVDETSMNVDESRPHVPPDPSSSRRSQTVPIPPRERHPTPLRRSTTSARLGALQHALTLVSDDASQTPVPVLMQASRLVHEIGAALNEQMSRELNRR